MYADVPAQQAQLGPGALSSRSDRAQVQIVGRREDRHAVELVEGPGVAGVVLQVLHVVVGCPGVAAVAARELVALDGQFDNHPRRMSGFARGNAGPLTLTIEVLDAEVGYQHEAGRLPFSAITYGPADDVVVISISGRGERYPVALRHMVWHPVEVDLAADDVPQLAVGVVEPDSTTTLVVFYPA